jgi:hypothetical protein
MESKFHVQRAGQSVDNGSLLVAMAAFSPQALGGDLWAPRFQQKGGPPIKMIEEQSYVDRKAKEILTLTPKNQKNVWKWCEEALNISWKIELAKILFAIIREVVSKKKIFMTTIMNTRT